jgi:hypothetical protein
VERSLSSGKVEGTKQPVTQDKEFWRGIPWRICVYFSLCHKTAWILMSFNLKGLDGLDDDN